MSFTIAGPPPLWTEEGRHYRIHMPPDITVVAACEDVGCDQYGKGWDTVCDLDTPEGAMVAGMIRSGQSGRTYREYADLPGARVVIFHFDSGQRCFREHRTRPGRALVMRRGRVIREHTSLADLAEDYSEHMGIVNDQLERG